MRPISWVQRKPRHAACRKSDHSQPLAWAEGKNVCGVPPQTALVNPRRRIVGINLCVVRGLRDGDVCKAAVYQLRMNLGIHVDQDTSEVSPCELCEITLLSAGVVRQFHRHPKLMRNRHTPYPIAFSRKSWTGTSVRSIAPRRAIRSRSRSKWRRYCFRKRIPTSRNAATTPAWERPCPKRMMIHAQEPVKKPDRFA